MEEKEGSHNTEDTANDLNEVLDIKNVVKPRVSKFVNPKEFVTKVLQSDKHRETRGESEGKAYGLLPEEKLFKAETATSEERYKYQISIEKQGGSLRGKPMDCCRRRSFSRQRLPPLKNATSTK